MIQLLNLIDQRILFFIQTNMRYPIVDTMMILVTTSGDKGLIWIIFSLLLLTNKNTQHIGIMALSALLLSVVLGEGILKPLIQRPRPFIEYPTIDLLINQPITYAFPSGHTAMSFAPAFVLTRYIKRFTGVIWMIAILIAYSRLYLFVHYPSDIVGGVVLGLICGKTIVHLYVHKIKKKLPAEQNDS